MNISWDPFKARRNIAKHGIAFEDAEVALADPLALTREDPDAVGEQRFVTVGVDAVGQVVAVVFAYGATEIRLVSARRATRKEIDAYAKGI